MTDVELIENEDGTSSYVRVSEPKDKAITAAVLAAKPVDMKGENSHLGTKYTRLFEINEEVKRVCTEHKVLYSFTFGQDDKGTTLLIFEAKGEGSGVTSAVPINFNQRAQAVMAEVTYYKRMILSAFFGIVGQDEDTDGEHDRPQPQPQSKFAEKANKALGGKGKVKSAGNEFNF